MNKLNKSLSIAGSSVLILMVASGCMKNDWEEDEQREKEIIQEYLTENNIPESALTEGGIYYIEDVPGTGSSPVRDDFIVIEYVGRYIEDNRIHETTYDSLKDDWSASASFKYYVYGPVKFIFGYSIPGMNEGIAWMKEGGRSTMVIPSDKAFYDFHPLVYEVELIKVIPDPEQFEDSVLVEYLAVKGFDETTRYDSIWFKETVTPDPADPVTVEAQDTVLLRFTGRLVDGYWSDIRDNRVFDTNTDDEAPLKIVYKGKTSNPVIVSGSILSWPPGLVTAIDTMRSGTHATAVVRYQEGFGDDGLFNSQYGYLIVPQYQTLVYDIVVEEIMPAAAK
jgi:FKBP-type peptidyl-prolyl cis-trans isomerase